MQHPPMDNTVAAAARNVETPRPNTPLSQTMQASLQELVDQAERVRSLTHDRLHPFNYPETEEVPEDSNPKMESPRIAYPPFYATVRDACDEISQALAEVERMLIAAEL